MIREEIKDINNSLRGISFEDERILVTGGAGFLGSWICESLIEQNAKVICLDSLYSGLTENIQHLFDNDNFNFIKHDISKPIHLDKKIDYVLHLASRASPFEFDKYPIQILKSNTMGTMTALGVAKKDDAKFLFSSTSEIYGEASIFPTPETFRGYVNTLGKRGCYDEAKRAGEAFCMAYFRQHNLDVRITRIFNTYGPRMRSDGIYGRVIPRFIMQSINNEPITIFGDGNQTRSFCYVTDLIKGLLKLLKTEKAKGETVNLGNPHEISIIELAQKIKMITKSESELIFLPLPQDDPTRRCPDISKAKNLLNWTPSVELKEGIGSLIKNK